MKFPALKSMVSLVMMAFAVLSAPADGMSENSLQLNVIEGDWARTDGAYRVHVGNVKSDGSATVNYFNPRPIYVSQSEVSYEKQLVKLFFKLDDKGYPGSTYTLFYYAEGDALVGIYYQAAAGQTFEVMFTRISTR
jgi:hypothetical protein